MLGWLVSAALCYGALAAGAFLLQQRLLYPAPTERVVRLTRDARLHEIEGGSGRKVYAVHLAAKTPEAPTLVHFHGNGEALEDVLPIGYAFQEAGLGVFLVEYPGYGLASEYSPNEADIYEDAERALRHLEGPLGVPRTRMVLQGQSLGSGVAVELALRGHGSRLVLISPYTSIVALGREIFFFLPVGTLLRDRFDSAAKAPNVALPTLVVHGTDDEVIAFAMGQEIAARIPHAVLHPIEGGHHNDLWAQAGSELVELITHFCRGRAPSAGSKGR